MIQKIKAKIQNFFLTNYFIRRIKLFFYQSFLPTLFKASLLIVALIIISFIILKIFKPEYLSAIYSKSSFYFRYYLNLDNNDFKKINVSGNIHVQESDIINIIKSSKEILTADDPIDYQPLVANLIKKIKEKLPWVNQVTIIRNMPNIINVIITEYEPFAIWQNEKNKYLTDKEGHLIPYEDSGEFDDMVILSGKGANINAKSLFNIFTIDPSLSSNVYSATWVSKRRWDIRFESGLLIKLPEKNISDAWQSLIKIYKMPGSILGLKMIDLRISDKIYLEYDDSVIKELKTL